MWTLSSPTGISDGTSAEILSLPATCCTTRLWGCNTNAHTNTLWFNVLNLTWGVWGTWQFSVSKSTSIANSALLIPSTQSFNLGKHRPLSLYSFSCRHLQFLVLLGFGRSISGELHSLCPCSIKICTLADASIHKSLFIWSWTTYICIMDSLRCLPLDIPNKEGKLCYQSTGALSLDICPKAAQATDASCERPSYCFNRFTWYRSLSPALRSADRAVFSLFFFFQSTVDDTKWCARTRCSLWH